MNLFKRSTNTVEVTYRNGTDTHTFKDVKDIKVETWNGEQFKFNAEPKAGLSEICETSPTKFEKVITPDEPSIADITQNVNEIGNAAAKISSGAATMGAVVYSNSQHKDGEISKVAQKSVEENCDYSSDFL